MRDIKKILVGIDFSEYSREAARYAVYLAEKLDAKVWFLHVAKLPAYYGGGVGQVSGASLKNHLDKEKELKNKGLKEMRRFVGEFEEHDHVMEFICASGNAKMEILQRSEEMQIDLIIVGTHGKKGLSRYLIGSVAEKVLRKATCQVLTVKLKHQSKDSSE